MDTKSHVPMPNEWHPAYVGMDFLRDWLDGTPTFWGTRGNHVELPIMRQVEAAFLREGEQMPTTGRPFNTMLMRRERCFGPAPFVGRPFVYIWSVGVDEMGRCIAGNAHIHHHKETL